MKLKILVNKKDGEISRNTIFSIFITLLSSFIAGIISGFYSPKSIKYYFLGKEKYLLSMIGALFLLLILFTIIIIKIEKKFNKIKPLKIKIFHSFSKALNESKLNPANNSIRTKDSN